MCTSVRADSRLYDIVNSSGRANQVTEIYCPRSRGVHKRKLPGNTYPTNSSLILIYAIATNK